MKIRRVGISALIAAAILSILLIPSIAFAGNINGYEADIISQASGTFKYQGKSYVATQAAKQELRSYLSQDDIDLTADQASRALSMMYSNVKAGVIEGYLVPLEGKNSKTSNKTQKNITTAKAGKATIKIDKDYSVFTVASSGQDEIFSGQLPVKNTGIRLNTFFIMLVIIGSLLPAGIIISYRFKLFAHNNNEH